MWFQQNSYDARPEKQSETQKSFCVFPLKSGWYFFYIFLECKSSLRSVDSSPMWENSNNSLKTHFIIITFTLFSIVFLRNDWNSKLALMDPQPSSSSSNVKIFTSSRTLSFPMLMLSLLRDDDRSQQLFTVIDFPMCRSWTGGRNESAMNWN